MLILGSAVISHAQRPVHLDSSKSVRQRVDDLLRRMTLEEKVGQMNMPCSYLSVFGKSREDKLEFSRRFVKGTWLEGIGPGGGLSTLVYEGVAEDQKQAGIFALSAGVDVERAQEIVHKKEHQDVAHEAAREGIVLLKNDNRLLPLSKNIKSIAVIGPNADHEKNLLGDYTSINVTQDIVTILEGIQSKVGGSANVRYVKGCDVIGDDLNEIKQARQLASQSDVAIVVVGENEWRTPGKKGTVGEGYDSATLELTGMQQELVKAVCDTGTPTVVVLVNGRPLATRWIAEHVPAIVEAWCPGEKGGAAVADVLFGDYNPSGHLPVTIPRHVGQLPVYYNYPPSKKHWLENAWGKPYVDMEPTPLYAFGHGLSYTAFKYSDLKITPRESGPGGKIHIAVTITNTGKSAGADVVQLYVNDPISTVSTPVKELKGFKKVWLKPGESTEVQFELGPMHLSLVNRYLKRVVEPGEFKVMVGHSSDEIALQGTFKIMDKS